MPADIASLDGKPMMAYAAREIPWHRLGTPLPEERLTSDQVIEAAGLDWTVRLDPVYVLGPDGSPIRIEGRSAVVRDVDNEVLGVVGSHYTPLQNREAFLAIDEWLKDSRVRYETAGALGRGERVFILVRTGEDFLVGGKDPVAPYVLVTTSHNGTSSVVVKLATTRVVCANTLYVALREGGSEIRIRHTASVAQRLAEAARALELVDRRQREMMERFERLAQMRATEEIVERAFRIAIPEPPAEASDATKRRHEEQRADLWRLYLTSPTVAVADRDTRWGVLNAVTEYLDWIQPRSGQSVERHGVSAIEKRALYSLEGPVAVRRRRVMEALLAE